MSDDQMKWDPIFLFTRTDEKYEEIRADMHDLEIEQKDLKSSIDRVERRVDFGVAVTGQKNTDELKIQAIQLSQLNQTIQILTNSDTGVFKQIRELADAVKLIYKGILTIFFTLVGGGAVLYALNFFHFSRPG